MEPQDTETPTAMEQPAAIEAQPRSMFFCEPCKREFGTKRGLFMHEQRNHVAGSPWANVGAKASATRTRKRAAKLGWKRRKRSSRDEGIEGSSRTHEEISGPASESEVNWCPRCGLNLAAHKAAAKIALD